MDLIPINPIGNNLIKAATGTQNDGGSKSQGGYVNARTGENKNELKISDEGKRLIGEDPVIDEKSFFDVLKEFILSLLRSITKIFSFKKAAEKKQESQKVETTETGEHHENNEVKDFLGYTRHNNE